MITAKEREAAFRADLDALLKKHGAEIDINDPNVQCSPVLTVSMISVWDNKANVCQQELCEFNL